MVRRRERYEARFNAMNLAKSGDDEIYNVMVNRLEQALDDGTIDGGMDDSIHSHREQAHILLHQATSSLTSTNTDRRRPSSASHNRQQAADWAKANAEAIQPRHSSRSRNKGSLLLKERILYGDPDDSSEDDESDTEQEINTTRALLEEAAARLNAGSGSLDAGINNIIYSRLMEELGLKAPSTARQPSISKSTTSSKPSEEPSSSPVSLRERREYAASMLAESKTKDFKTAPSLLLPNPLLASSAQLRLERRHSAMEILQNLQQKQKGKGRRMSTPCQDTINAMQKQQQSASAARARQAAMLSASENSHTKSKPGPRLARQRSDPVSLRTKKRSNSNKLIAQA